MSKIKWGNSSSSLDWDVSGERLYETGISHGVLYVWDPTKTKPSSAGTDNNYGRGWYGDGVVWNGLISVSESPEGAEVTDLYADDMKYASFRSAETFKATIEAYMYPDEFMDCDGSATLGSMTGVRLGQQYRRPFCFCYRSIVGDDQNSNYGTVDMYTGNDERYKLHIIYGCTASPSERQYQTINDSPDAITFSWELDSTPVMVDGYKPTSIITIDSGLCDSEILKQIEQALYGTASTAGRILFPDEIAALTTTAG